MNGLAVRSRRLFVDHRFHQLVAEAEPAVRACGEQPRVHSLLPRGRVEAEHTTGLAHGVAIAAVIGGDENERGAGRRGQPLDPGAESAAQTGPHSDLVTGERMRRDVAHPHGRGQFLQREGISGRRTDRTADNHLVSVRSDGTGQEPGILVAQSPDLHRRQFLPGAVARVVVSGEEHDHRLAAQAAGNESQALHGGLVQPLGVVGDDQHRPLLGQLTDERQYRHADQKPVGHVAAVAERPAQGFDLRLRQRTDPLRYRPQQLVKCGERQTRLQPRTPAAQHREVEGGGLGHVFEQRGLADAGVTPQHQGFRVALTSSVKDFIKGRLLMAPSVQVHLLESLMAWSSARQSPPGSSSASATAVPSPAFSDSMTDTVTDSLPVLRP